MVELIGRRAENPTVLSDDRGWLEHPPPDFLTHTPAPFELKVPYVARVFTSRFQVFPFVVVLRCGPAFRPSLCWTDSASATFT